MGAGEPTVGRLGDVAGDTVHFDVIDRAGNMVSATPSGGWLQSSPVIPDLGFCLGTRAQMFWLEEGHRPRSPRASVHARHCRPPWRYATVSRCLPGGLRVATSRTSGQRSSSCAMSTLGKTSRRRSTRRRGIPSISRSHFGRARRGRVFWCWKAACPPTAARSCSGAAIWSRLARLGRKAGSLRPRGTGVAARPPPIPAACRATLPADSSARSRQTRWPRPGTPARGVREVTRRGSAEQDCPRHCRRSLCRCTAHGDAGQRAILRPDGARPMMRHIAAFLVLMAWLARRATCRRRRLSVTAGDARRGVHARRPERRIGAHRRTPA